MSHKQQWRCSGWKEKADFELYGLGLKKSERAPLLLPPWRPRLGQTHFAVFALQHVTSAETQACLESPGVRPRPLDACLLARSLTPNTQSFSFHIPAGEAHTRRRCARAEARERVRTSTASPWAPPAALRRDGRRRCRSALWVKCVSPPRF